MSNFKARASGNPLILAAAGLMFTAGFLLAYKEFYRPYAKRKHYMEQEELMQPLLQSRNLESSYRLKRND